MHEAIHAIWYVALALGLASLGCLVAAIVSERFNRWFSWSSKMAGKLAIIIVGTFFLVFPIAAFDMDGSGNIVWQTLSESIPGAIYETAQVLVLQVGLDTWSLEVFGAIGEGILGHVYFWLLVFFAIACPVALAMTAIDVVLNGLSGFAVRAKSLKKAVRRAPIYVFYGLSDNTVTLALDLLAHVGARETPARERMPLLVFTNVSGESASSGESFEGQVREAAAGVADIVVTPMVLEDLPRHIAPWARKRCQTHYLVISNDEALNVRTTIRLTDVFVEELLARELDRLNWNVARVAERPEVSDETRALAANIHVWCTHDNPDDDLIFDSLPFRGPSEEIMSALLRAREGHAHLSSPAAIARRVLPLEQRIRSLFEVRLIFEAREMVWDALVEHPLTEVLDPIDLSRGAPPAQRLFVLVVGLGASGVEAVKAAFWFGRLPGVELNICAVDRDASARLLELGAAAPGLVEERHATPSGSRVPTVTLIEADPASLDLECLLKGDEMRGLTLENGEVRSLPFRLPDEAHVYAMATLEDDSENMAIALRLQRALADRALEGRLPAALRERPVVSLELVDEELFDSVAHLADGEEVFPLTPFGATYRTFSYESVLAAPWERAALNLQGAHEAAFALARGGSAEVSFADAVESYNSLEVRKLSDRAEVRFAIYRLWCLGLDHGSGLDDDLHEEWLEKLDAVGVLEAAHEGDPEARACVSGTPFATEAMDAASREARVAQTLAESKVARDRWPVLSALGDLEHARWCAFFRAQGWRTIADFDELERTMALVGRTDEPAWPYPHQSTRLHAHYYLVDDPIEAARRGAECRDDPCSDDRLIVLETIRALRGDIVPLG